MTSRPLCGCGGADSGGRCMVCEVEKGRLELETEKGRVMRFKVDR